MPVSQNELSPWWRRAVIVVIAAELVVLLGIAISAYRPEGAPPIPGKSVDSSGKIVFTGADVIAGQQVFLKYGLMNNGTVWGHGAYLGPDFTAEYLHLLALGVGEYLSDRSPVRPGGGLESLDRLSLQSQVHALLSQNRYDPHTGVLTLTPPEVSSFQRQIGHWRAFFSSTPANRGLPVKMISDPDELRQLTAFFAWTAWAATALAPGKAYSYTNNFPYDPAVGNGPSGPAILWSGLSLISLLVGIALVLLAFGRFRVLGWHRAQDLETASHLMREDAGPAERATLKFFVLATAMLLAQTLVGGLLAHYTVDPRSFYGFDLTNLLPSTVLRSWHLQLAILWIATAFVGGGLTIASALGNSQPRWQAAGINLLFLVLLGTVGGSLLGEWAGVKQLLGNLWFWIGNQGWEYLEIGRAWQVMLALGLVLWTLLLVRAVAPARQDRQRREVTNLFLLTAFCIPIFYLPAFFFKSTSHFTIVDTWRFFIIHLWVEGFFELFATVMVAMIFLKLGLVSQLTAKRIIYLDAILFLGSGTLGTGHHWYWTGQSAVSMALSATFSAMEVVPLVLLTLEASGFVALMRSGKDASGQIVSFPHKWAFYFLIAVGVWNFLGAGVFGFLINLPVVSYYEAGTNLTANHAHGALMGVFGMLGVAFVVLALRQTATDADWHVAERLIRVSFWGLNLGLLGMVGLNLFPGGVLQFYDVITNGYWHARSPAFLDHWFMQALAWARLPADLIFIGAGALPLFLAAAYVYWRAWRRAEETSSADTPPPTPPSQLAPQNEAGDIDTSLTPPMGGDVRATAESGTPQARAPITPALKAGSPDTPTIYVDNQPYSIAGYENGNLLEACLALGFDLPYFCWHPAMHSVGACRQCAVKVFKNENDKKGRIVMSCMTDVHDGMRISISDEEAAAFRRSVAEWLMVNHPHDCPVCDEGGECHLQDMTIMNGHVYRRYRFDKRTHRNQYLGPFVNHEMNRCIQCYRCVRFYCDYAGGRDFNVFGWHDHVYFGRFEDGVLESEFAGNLVEVCPTGVFTDKTFKQHFTRKWDLQTAPSVCVHCGLGCNTIPGERYGMLRRIRARYNYDVNGYFLCDRGRYGYEFVNSDKRLREPRLRRSASDTFDEASPATLSETLSDIVRNHGLIGIGSPRASVEANLALRTLVGEANFHSGLSERNLAIQREILRVLREGPVASASLAEVGKCDAALVLGEDIPNDAPMLALSLRQTVLQAPLKDAKTLHLHSYEDTALREAVQRTKGPLYIASSVSTRLDDAATQTYRAAPDDIALLGFAVAQALDPASPKPEGVPPEIASLAREIAEQLKMADLPVIIAGHCTGAPQAVQAAANVAWALQRTGQNVRLFFTAPHCNSMGAAMLGGGSLEAALARLEHDATLATIVLENDLHRELAEETADRLLRAAEHLVVIDHLENATTPYADVILPAATFAESTGTLINNEGRAQRHFEVFVPEGSVRESWRWIAEMIEARNGRTSWDSLDDLILEADKLSELAGTAQAAPLSDFRMVGQKLPRQPERYSGRTAMHANETVHEPPPPDDPDAPFNFSMEGHHVSPPPSLIARYRAPGWNSPQAITRYQETVAGPLRGGPAGKRLIAPSDNAPAYNTVSVAAFSRREDALLVVPVHHVFGSEELSVHSPGISELAPKPYVALHPRDLERLKLEPGQTVEVLTEHLRLRVLVEACEDLPEGVAALTAGLPGLPGMSLPDWATVTGFGPPPNQAGETL
ncbi:MAG: NADH-quinone oxidoreductase subunit NuoG [Armatimonadia bacterium]